MLDPGQPIGAPCPGDV